MKKSLTLVALAFMSLCSAAQAEQGDSLYLHHLDVSYGDLNLANPDGARMMFGRIKLAASAVCGGAPDSMLDLTSRRFYKTCVRAATADAMSQLKAPLVSQHYRETDARLAQAD